MCLGNAADKKDVIPDYFDSAVGLAKKEADAIQAGKPLFEDDSELPIKPEDCGEDKPVIEIKSYGGADRYMACPGASPCRVPCLGSAVTCAPATVLYYC